MERCTRATAIMRQASTPLRAELTIDSAKPHPRSSSGWGSKRRCTATQIIPSAAPTISRPSKPLEKYSAFEWPKGCSSSGGASATVTIANAKMAEARFTKDSMASESRPTESVTHQAAVLSAIVTTAVAMESLSRVLVCMATAAESVCRGACGRQASVTRANLRLPTCTT